MELESYWRNLGGCAESLEDAAWGWNTSQACYPAGGPEFVKPANIAAWCGAAGMGAEDEWLLQRCASLLRADESLCRFAWHIYWRDFVCLEFRPMTGWPAMHSLGELRGVFYALIALGYVPLVQAYHQGLGIPAETTRETLQQYRIFCNVNYRRGHDGRFGIFVSQMNWLHHYTCSPLFRIGRFEYWIQPSFREVIVYRNRRSRQVVALALPGMMFDADGFAYRNPEDYRGDAFTAIYEEHADCVVGTPFSPLGYAENRRVTLPLAEWEAVMKPGDVCLSLHIPAGGGMTLESCRESLLRAKAFFAAHFPQMMPKAVVSSSWIFNPELKDILGADAHVVEFQKELFLHSIKSGPEDGLWFIFLHEGKWKLAEAPCVTTMQRRVLEFLKNGGTWRVGGMFLLMDDIEHFGTQPYRTGK